MNQTHPDKVLQGESKDDNVVGNRNKFLHVEVLGGIVVGGGQQSNYNTMTRTLLLRRRSSSCCSTKSSHKQWYLVVLTSIAILIVLHSIIVLLNDRSRLQLHSITSSIVGSSTSSSSSISEEQQQLTSSAQQQLRLQQTKEPIPSFTEQRWSDVKLLIYMTTHLPEQHIAFLPCWKDAAERLQIFQNADLMLYTSVYPTVEQLNMLQPFQNVIIKNYTNPGYHEGAVQAMLDPFLDSDEDDNTTTWFDEYDWVIRVNPDVVIRHDTWLIQTMLNPNIDFIGMDCWAHSSPVHFQSDFFAFRPNAISKEQWLDHIVSGGYVHAETHITKSVQHLYDAGRTVMIPGAKNEIEAFCRIAGVHSPVLHVHEISNYCPYYYNITKEGFY